MQFFNVIVACLIVPVIVRIILPFLQRAQPSKDNIVRMPRFFGIAGVICGVLAFAGLFALHFYHNSLFQALVGCCAVLSCTNVLISNSFFLVYDDDGFTVWRLLQRPHRFQYADITGIRPYGDSSFRLLLRNGSVLIDAMAVGGSEFAAFAEARYCETTGAFCIPDNRSGLFNGNVLNPIQFVVAGGLFIACGAVAVICTTIGFLESRELPVPFNERIVHFEQCTQKDQELLLLADGTVFSVRIDTVMNQQGLEQAIFRGEHFIMQCGKTHLTSVL